MTGNLLHRRALLLAPAAAAASRWARAADRKPNVVIIVAGSWRAQSVPWAGDAALSALAPNLAKFAGEATVFSRAYSCYGRLERARPCLASGVFPHMTGDAALPSLESALGNAGYRTVTRTARQTDQVIPFVHDPSNQPFFVQWTVDGAAASLIERGARATLGVPENVPAASEREARRELALFYARARSWDREIGTLLAALDRPGLTENTIVVVTAYHGEQFRSHGESGDDWVYEESIRIPLAIRYPGVLGAAARSEILVSQVDLMPTLLAWCGVQIPGSVQGRDLSSIMSGKSADRPDSVYAEGRRGQKDEWRMVVQGYDKLAAGLEGNVTHVYNLAEDPYEMTNLAAASTQQLKRDAMLALMRAWMRKLGDGVDASGLRKR